MTHFSWALTVLLFLFSPSLFANAQQDQPKQTQAEQIPDTSKRVVELPLKILMADKIIPKEFDGAKNELELPLKNTIGQSSLALFELKPNGQPARVVENPIEKSGNEIVIGDLAKDFPKFESKAFIEAPTELLVGRATDVSRAELVGELKEPQSQPESEATVSEHSNSEVDNPFCKPGLVNWHPDFETACAASTKSGKPVLLFHLLGQLDQRFT